MRIRKDLSLRSGVFTDAKCLGSDGKRQVQTGLSLELIRGL